MEFSLSGTALKTFARSITCLARIGNELVLQSSSSQLCLHTLNSSRSAYQSITFKPDFFDVFSVSGSQVQCSVLLKAICSVLRTPVASIDHLAVQLADSDASKVQWALDCSNGMKKTYWITCNIEPDIQHLSLDRRKLPSSFVVRPRDLNRLLANFQSTLQEITIISTQQSALPLDAADQIGGKAVEFRSYIDPTKENDSSLHTQLWIDPAEEFVQYTHTRDPVDVTFGVRELKAFLSFCEGCEVDIHLYFDKAGEPILMAPKFGIDDGSFSNFDATLVLATMLVSQLRGGNSSEPPAATTAQQGTKGNTSEHPSDHTRIWSELSGSAVRYGNAAQDQPVPGERNQNTNEHTTIQRIGAMNISMDKNAGGVPVHGKDFHPAETDDTRRPEETNGHAPSQHHPSNWIDAEEDDDDEGDDSELCVQSTPPYS
ncbi:cell cycle checkpoint control protein RAD9A-like [Salvia splendens]|uniref:cell cycle checkpoint control protein RAD9A-like n=1 Tax=Salvia splendens TaxID=180675 RepID=UPI001C25CAB7|nr:cell cycle checkpoint control protein RAD9A-like [Salvia splendens]